MSAAIVDASAMVALFGRNQPSQLHYQQLFSVAAQAQWSLTSTWPCVTEASHRYTESPRTEMDLADASLLWLASDTGINRIMTLDVRDFSRYRLPDGRAFEIL